MIIETIHSSQDGLFEINAVTGHLTVERVLDRETDITSYTIIVGAADNGNPPMRLGEGVVYSRGVAMIVLS